VKISQKEAVYSVVIDVLTKNSLSISGDVAPYITDDIRIEIEESLFEMFNDGLIEIDKCLSQEKLRVYVSGLRTNWIRRDSRLNGRQ